MPVAVEAEPIQYEVDGHVARIWLNRPHKRNSVSQQLLQELDEARIRAENDPRGPRDRDPRARGDILLGVRPRRAAGRLHRTVRRVRGRTAVGARLRRDLQLVEAVRERARGLHHRGWVRDHDQLRLLDRRGGREDRRLPHAARAVRRCRADLPAAADPRRAPREGAHADGQADHRSPGLRVGARQRRARRPRSSTSASTASSRSSPTRARSRWGSRRCASTGASTPTRRR